MLPGGCWFFNIFSINKFYNFQCYLQFAYSYVHCGYYNFLCHF